MINIEEMKEKFEDNVFKILDMENCNKIIKFLLEEKCDYIEDIVSDYLDLFNIQYEEFRKKYGILNVKYNGKYIEKVSEDMNLLEEFYEI